MSRIPVPPSPGFGPGMAGPSAAPPGPFAAAGYPPPPAPGFVQSEPAAFGAVQPKFAPKLRIRKTPEMLGFRAVDTIGTIVTAIFAVWIPLSIYELVLSLDRRRLVHQYGLQIPFALEHSLDDRLDMVHGFSAVLFLIAAPLFLVWFARAYGNLPTISPGPTQSRTLVATLMWIIPFAQFIRPFGYLKEMWARTDALEARKPTPPTLIFVYWFSYIALQIVEVLIAVGYVRGTNNADDLNFAADLNVLAAGIGIACAALIGVIVWMVTRRMTQRCGAVTDAVMKAPQHG